MKGNPHVSYLEFLEERWAYKANKQTNKLRLTSTDYGSIYVSLAITWKKFVIPSTGTIFNFLVQLFNLPNLVRSATGSFVATY